MTSREQHRAQADALRALDVVAQAVTNEHGPTGRDVEGIEQGVESLRVRLHMRELTGVDPHV